MNRHATQSVGCRRGAKPPAIARQVNYRNLKNPFLPQTVLSEDRVNYLH